ncbi:hypothetical protein BGW80DRAFT_1347089 [Lactifluus volemus]|nr:hypothetical protein BGW80DRAFT_1347089 [Lactifluus volemus]
MLQKVCLGYLQVDQVSRPPPRPRPRPTETKTATGIFLPTSATSSPLSRSYRDRGRTWCTG